MSCFWVRFFTRFWQTNLPLKHFCNFFGGFLFPLLKRNLTKSEYVTSPSEILALILEYATSSWLLKLVSCLHNRWALKQEKLENLGQWKHTKAQNPLWNKLAYSWPVNAKGEWNEDCDWPMEGYLIPYAPSIKKMSRKASAEVELADGGEQKASVMRSKFHFCFCLLNSCPVTH